VKIFFDVHGTLLSTDGGGMRPGTGELLRDLTEAGHEVYLWSTAGAGYVRTFAGRFGLLPWIHDCHDKHEPSLRPEFCVDDHPGYLAGSLGNLLVSSYRGVPEDRELERVRIALMESA
jgi:hypothetical protein